MDSAPTNAPDIRFYSGIASASLGAVSLIIMGISLGQIASYQHDEGFVNYRAGFTPDQSACDQAALKVQSSVAGSMTAAEAHALCKNANAWHGAAIATGVMGGVGLATGAGLILTSRTVLPKLTGRAFIWQLLPVVGAQHAGAIARASF
jgi:hypothetical protein